MKRNLFSKKEKEGRKAVRDMTAACAQLSLPPAALGVVQQLVTFFQQKKPEKSVKEMAAPLSSHDVLAIFNVIVGSETAAFAPLVRFIPTLYVHGCPKDYKALSKAGEADYRAQSRQVATVLGEKGAYKEALTLLLTIGYAEKGEALVSVRDQWKKMAEDFVQKDIKSAETVVGAFRFSFDACRGWTREGEKAMSDAVRDVRVSVYAALNPDPA